MKLSYTYDEHTYSTRDTDLYNDQATFRGAIKVLAEAFGIHEKSVLYLAQNGWSQSLQDSYAQARSKKRKDLKLSREDVDTESVKETCHASIAKRIQGIHEGLLSATGSGGRDPIKSIGLQLLHAWAESKGKSLPKDADKKAKLLEKFVELNRAEIDAEIVRRRKIKGPEVDLDDLED